MNPIVAYIKTLLKAHRDLIGWPLKCASTSSNQSIALFVSNLRLRLKGKKIRFGVDPKKNLYFVEEKGIRHYFASLERGLALYRGGIQPRASALWGSYFLDKVSFSSDDIIIDCGANYADLWLALKGRINEKNYITFEPGEGEFRSVCSNAMNSQNNSLGLGDRNERKMFYVNDQDADSSVIEPSSYSETIEIETETLDSYVARKGLGKVRLFKVEAEGFEPEILEGARETLIRTDYVAIDGGHERGVTKEETFSNQANILADCGFKMMHVNFKMGRALFKNTRLSG